jgi:hypothetical protein
MKGAGNVEEGISISTRERAGKSQGQHQEALRGREEILIPPRRVLTPQKEQLFCNGRGGVTWKVW